MCLFRGSASRYEGWSFRSFEEGREAFRAMEQAEASPEVARLSDESETALSMALGSSAQVRACFARQLFRASAGRSDNTAHGAEEAFVTFWNQLPSDQQGNVIESLVAYVKNPTFAQRRAP